MPSAAEEALSLSTPNKIKAIFNCTKLKRSERQQTQKKAPKQGLSTCRGCRTEHNAHDKARQTDDAGWKADVYKAHVQRCKRAVMPLTNKAYKKVLGKCCYLCGNVASPGYMHGVDKVDATLPTWPPCPMAPPTMPRGSTTWTAARSTASGC